MIAQLAVAAAVYAIDKPYSYRVPEGMQVQPGLRVLVPFGRGNRRSEAVVLALQDTAQRDLKVIERALDDAPILSQAQLQLAAFMKERYFCTFYEAVKAILPALLYFTGIFIAVHLEAKKLGLKGLSRDEMPAWKDLGRKSYLLLPLILLVWLVSSGAKTMQLMFLIIGVLTSLVLFLVRKPIISVYNASVETAELANIFVLILCVTAIGTAYEMPCLTGIVSGGGDTNFVFFNDIVFMWCIVLPLSALSAFYFKFPPAVTFALLKADQILKCFVAIVKVNRFKWVRVLTR